MRLPQPPPLFGAAPPLDLRPAGIDLVLDGSAAAQAAVRAAHAIRVAAASPGPGGGLRIVALDGGVLDVARGALLGEGQYGAVYEAWLSGAPMVLKEVDLRRGGSASAALAATVQEAIAQAVVVAVTARLPGHEGPFAPVLRCVAVDAAAGRAFLLQERMEASLSELLDAYAPAPGRQLHLFAWVVHRVAAQLAWLGGALQFAHRDLKRDNVMYVRDGGGVVRPRLIDFGFACLTYGGVRVAVGTWFDPARTCFRASRDLTMLLYSVQLAGVLPAGGRGAAFLDRTLTFRVPSPGGGEGTEVCVMYRGCRGATAKARNWVPYYRFMDARAENPNGVPAAVMKNAARLLRPEFAFVEGGGPGLPGRMPAAVAEDVVSPTGGTPSPPPFGLGA